MHRELRRPDVTLTLLWEEYKAREPDGFSYSCSATARGALVTKQT